MVAHSSRFNILAVFCSSPPSRFSLFCFRSRYPGPVTQLHLRSTSWLEVPAPGDFYPLVALSCYEKVSPQENKDKSASSTKGKPVSVLSLRLIYRRTIKTSRISRRHYEDGDLAHVGTAVVRHSSGLSEEHYPADAQAYVSRKPKGWDFGRVYVMVSPFVMFSFRHHNSLMYRAPLRKV